MNEQMLSRLLAAALDGDVTEFEELTRQIRHVSLFTEDGVLTTDHGVVLRMNDGSKFNITITR